MHASFLAQCAFLTINSLLNFEPINAFRVVRRNVMVWAIVFKRERKLLVISVKLQEKSTLPAHELRSASIKSLIGNVLDVFSYGVLDEAVLFT